MTPEAEQAWVKYDGNPVLGGALGTVFDISVLVTEGRHRMWFSWRPKHGIGYAESSDGLHWEAAAAVVLPYEPSSEHESLEVTRPFVLDEGGHLTMWYSAHGRDSVVLSRATSVDGLTWTKHGPVLLPELPWEKEAVMCPSVLRGTDGTYHLWYSGGETYEPDAVGYATSPDGITWTRVGEGPVLRSGTGWESDRVAGAHVFVHNDWLYAAYIGFANGFEDSAIGIARSANGVHWTRHTGNPVLTRGAAGTFDSINIYKPFVVIDGEQWRMWFNASAPASGTDTSHDNRKEQVGYASCRFTFIPDNPDTTASEAPAS